MSVVRGFAGFVPAEAGAAAGAGSGTVTSVDVAIADVTSSGAITTAGTITLTWDSQAAHKVFAAPSGGAGVPTFRLLVAGDIPSLSGTYALASHTHAAADIVSGQLALAQGGTGADLSATGGSGKVLKQTSGGATITVATLNFTELAGTLALSQIASIADQRLLGNVSGGSAAPTTLTQSDILTFLGGTSGTGALVRVTSATLVTPALGTPSSGALTNCTGLPVSALVAGIMAENAYISLVSTGLSADGKYCGLTIEGTADAALSFGHVVYLKASNSRWAKAKADAASTSGDVLIGMCVLAAANAADATRILLVGTVRADAVFPSFTVAAPIYLSAATAGEVTGTQPSSTDHVIQRMGFALTADAMTFRPSNDYVSHV